MNPIESSTTSAPAEQDGVANEAATSVRYGGRHWSKLKTAGLILLVASGQLTCIAGIVLILSSPLFALMAVAGMAVMMPAFFHLFPESVPSYIRGERLDRLDMYPRERAHFMLHGLGRHH